MRSLILYGSSIYRPMKARDLDMLVIVDRILDQNEKARLEIEITRALKKIVEKVFVDVTVFDEESFRENLEPGALACGLLAGYEILYDDLKLEKLVVRSAEKIAVGRYVVQKNKRKINLSALARAKLKLSMSRTT